MAPIPSATPGACPPSRGLFTLALSVAFGIVLALNFGECCIRRNSYNRSQEALLATPARSTREARSRGTRRIGPLRPARPLTPLDGYGAFADFDGMQAAAYGDANLYSPSVRAQDLTDSQVEAVTAARSQPVATTSVGCAGSDLSNPPTVHPRDLTDFQTDILRSPATHTDNFTDSETHLPDEPDDQPTQASTSSQEIEVVRKFGESGEGQAMLVKQRKTGELFVLKEITVSKKCAAGHGKLPGEVKAFTQHLQKRHPNIVVFHSFNLFPDEDPSASHGFCEIVLEYCSGGDLADYCGNLFDRQLYTAPLFVLHFIASMSDALAFIHLGCGPSGVGSLEAPPSNHQPFIHCDIKPNNVFLRWTESSEHGMPTIVLGDWGFSTLERKSTGVCGTPGILPPEAIRVWDYCDTNPEAHRIAQRSQILTCASDVYTFGATLYTLAFTKNFDNSSFGSSSSDGGNPFEPPGLVEDFAATTLARFPAVLETMQRSLAEHPSQRVTTAELRNVVPMIKQLIARLYAAGVRWTDCAPRRQMLFTPSDLMSTPAVSASMPASSPASSLTSTKGMPSKREVTDSTDQTASVSRISGFADEFCWCANHRSLSGHRPGPDCVREPSVYQAQPVSQTSSLTDDFCWCANHRSLSHRRPGPECVREREVVVPVTTQEVLSATFIAPGCASTALQRLDAETVVAWSRFSDSSEDDFSADDDGFEY
ncbi:hypothetical protein LTR08_006000 [Meristemomyces frigidus]|nr:hypothetical protein LTR08_006000 [Meristemomyces frigidus]